MRSLGIVITDTLLVGLGTLLAFAFLVPQTYALNSDIYEMSYLGLSCLAAFFLFLQAGTGREIWDFLSSRIYKKIMAAVFLALLGTNVIWRLPSTLDTIPGSVPVLQFLFSVGLLIGCREIAQSISKLRLARFHPSRARKPAMSLHYPARTSESALILGVNGLAGVLIHMIETYAAGQIDLAGLAALRKEDVGRSAHGLRILGDGAEIERVMSDLAIHGVNIRLVILAVPSGRLPPAVYETLFRLERAGAIRLLEFKDVLALISTTEQDSLALLDAPPETAPAPRIRINDLTLDRIAQRPYWILKRGFDILIALIGLVLLAPVFVVITILVAIDLGMPVFFWQRRPGLGGIPFNVLKFRTMRPAMDKRGYLLSDAQRTSRIGAFLRETRLDELPQLFNILRGDMALIGPRPLLPHDQSETYLARLTVRPGMTGWAQVVGGRMISADDKAALDVWYVYNASLLLDLKILWRTIPVVMHGERVNHAEIAISLSEVQKHTA